MSYHLPFYFTRIKATFRVLEELRAKTLQRLAAENMEEHVDMKNYEYGLLIRIAMNIGWFTPRVRESYFDYSQRLVHYMADPAALAAEYAKAEANEIAIRAKCALYVKSTTELCGMPIIMRAFRHAVKYNITFCIGLLKFKVDDAAFCDDPYIQARLKGDPVIKLRVHNQNLSLDLYLVVPDGLALATLPELEYYVVFTCRALYSCPIAESAVETTEAMVSLFLSEVELLDQIEPVVDFFRVWAVTPVDPAKPAQKPLPKDIVELILKYTFDFMAIRTSSWKRKDGTSKNHKTINAGFKRSLNNILS